MVEIEDLQVRFRSRNGDAHAVRGANLAIAPAETVCLVGESGSGKSTLAMGMLGLLPASAEVTGRASFLGRDFLALSEREREDIRGHRIGVVFQDASRALNPVLSIGHQIAEVMQRHLGLERRAALARAVDLLTEVGIADAAQRIKDYPHQLSGGLKQRVMIAIAIACEPVFVIADEPTTALDVSVQRQVLALLRRLCSQRGLALLLITHDFGVVSAMADRVAVMYAGRIVELADVVPLFGRPLHPYTRALLAANPRLSLGEDGSRSAIVPIPGSLPDPAEAASGCSFAPRCASVFQACVERPPLVDRGDGHCVACWRTDG